MTQCRTINLVRLPRKEVNVMGVRVIDNILYISQGDDVAINLHLPYDDLRTSQEYSLQPGDYILVSIRYEASTYAPLLYETKIESKLLRISSDITKNFPVGKYSMTIFLYRKQSDGSYYKLAVYPNEKYMRLPTGREQNTKTFIVNAISEYKE